MADKIPLAPELARSAGIPLLIPAEAGGVPAAAVVEYLRAPPGA